MDRPIQNVFSDMNFTITQIIIQPDFFSSATQFKDL